MQIGELATRTGVSVRSIRHYEQAGLLHAARRANGYREFDDAAVARVEAIRELLATGCTVDDIRSLATCLPGDPDDAPDACGCCTRTTGLYREKLRRIDRQVAALLELRRRIEARITVMEPC